MHRIAQAEIRERLLPETLSYNRGAFCVWIVAFALLLGIVAFGSQQEWLLDYFQPVAYLAIVCSVILTLHAWRDPINPLCLVIAVGVVRFLVPGLLLFSGVEPEGEVAAFFSLMRLSDHDWQWGNALALMGLCGVVLGWLLVQGESVLDRPVKLQLSGGVLVAGIVGCVIGCLALIAFVLMNGSIGMILTGGFRGTIIQEGTGKFFFLAYLLIGGSALLTCYLLVKGRGWYSLVPVLIAAMFYSVLGGRARAMTPIAAGLLLLWYFRREKNSWRKISVKPRYIVFAPFIVAGAVWLSWVGILYRGESGASAFAEAMSLTGFWQHIQGSVFIDLGQLHSLAGAVAIGPGVLNGRTFYGALSWPLSSVLPIPGQSAGVFIVEELVGFGKNQERWGVNASLIGDAYLNFGLGGVAIVTLLLGVLLKVLYVKFRNGSLHGAIYSVALLSAVQAFWVSIDVWPQALSTVSFTVFLIWFGNTLLRVRRAPTG
jgi:oligosaccharide repeat unit polymerase